MSGRGGGGRQSPRTMGSPHTGAPGARYDERPPGGADFVVCAKHNARRKSSYCVQMPVYDADHKVVRYQFECRDSEPCNVKPGGHTAGLAPAAPAGEEASSIVAFDLSSSSAAHGKTGRAYTVQAPTGQPDRPAAPVGDAGSGDDADLTTHAPLEPSTADRTTTSTPSSLTAAPAVFQPSPSGGAGRAPPTRYYDTDHGSAGGGAGGGHRGGAGFPTRKVCWNCGLPGHEKPDCPNGLCRACHAKRRQGEYHHCVEVTLSDFFAVDTKLPQTADGLPACKCLYCGELGHLDCSAKSFSSSSAGAGAGHQGQMSCSYCGRRGHASYECGDRSHQAPDRYAMRQQQLARPWNTAAGGSGGGGGGGYQYGGQANAYDPRGGHGMAPAGRRMSPPPSGASYYNNNNNSHNRRDNFSHDRNNSINHRPYNGGGGGGYHQDRNASYGGNNYNNQGYSGSLRGNNSNNNNNNNSSGGSYRQAHYSREGDRDGYRPSSQQGRDRHSDRRGPQTSASSSSSFRDQPRLDERRAHRGSPTTSGSASHHTRHAGRKRYGSSDDEGPLY